MKVLKFILFFILIQNTAHASRAMIKNHQSFYHSDSLISYLLIPTLMDVGKDQILFESGSTIPNTTTTGSAFVGHKTLNEQWLLLAALGEQNDLIGGARARFNSDNAQSFMLMQNPVHLFLNYKFWGQNLVLGTSYSKYENKLGLDQEKSNTVALGYRFGLLHFDFHFAALDRSVLANGDELFTEQPLQFVGLTSWIPRNLRSNMILIFRKTKVVVWKLDLKISKLCKSVITTIQKFRIFNLITASNIKAGLSRTNRPIL